MNFSPMGCHYFPLILANQKLRHYIWAHCLKLVGYNPLKYLLSRPIMSGRIARWQLFVVKWVWYHCWKCQGALASSLVRFARTVPHWRAWDFIWRLALLRDMYYLKLWMASSFRRFFYASRRWATGIICMLPMVLMFQYLLNSSYLILTTKLSISFVYKADTILQMRIVDFVCKEV